MEIAYTDEFNRQAAVYFVTDHVADHIQYTESDDSDSMSTCSTRSASTITSSEVSDFRQERFGRMFPLDDNIPAVLPIDGPEHERLEKQHRYMRLLLGSNYFGPFREVMLQTPHPRVLDILTQEGLWVQEVAAEYPHGHFISLDVVPMLPHVPQPNITFEVYDLYAGLAEADNSFDVVHARCCIPTIKNYDMLLREFHRVLRPGGLLLIGELGHDAFEACDTNVPAYASAPQTHRGLAIIREAVSAQGVMLDTVSRIPEWLEPGSSLWTWSDVSPPLGQPRQTSRHGDSRRGFRGIMERVAHIPNGVWPADPVLQEVGALAQSVWKETWIAMVPLLLEYKIPRDEVRLILAGAIKELCDPSVRTVWKYHMIHCFKI